jgi:3-methyladenine DNA glycosylase AlkD
MVGRQRLPGRIASERRRVARELRTFEKDLDSEWLRSYLSSPVPVLGVSTPDLRSVARAAAQRLRTRPPSEIRAFMESLWAGKVFEEKVVAIELLNRRSLAPNDLAWRLGNRWVDSATGWALSDSLAGGPIAASVAAKPEHFADLLKWTRSANLWRRRASTYALRPWLRAGDLDPPFRLLERLLDDPERWVQRAVGTWLRECWKRDRVRTERFLLREARRLAPVTITVATERASPSFRAKLRATSRRGRPERRAY